MDLAYILEWEGPSDERRKTEAPWLDKNPSLLKGYEPRA
jgi:hypothetical protein